MEIWRTEGLKKYYGEGESQVKALDGVNLTVEEGEFAAVVGTSGSGKSTLLHVLGGLDYATSGRVWVRGQELSKLNETALTIFRRRNIGFVFQSYNLLPILTVYENIVLPLELDGRKPDQAFVEELLTVLGMKEKRDSLPGQLSGGQQQRAAIARALAAKPAIVLADEPTGNLDEETAKDIIAILKRMALDRQKCVIVVTHSKEVAQASDVVLELKKQQLIEKKK